jgi:hypothetical protein
MCHVCVVLLSIELYYLSLHSVNKWEVNGEGYFCLSIHMVHVPNYLTFSYEVFHGKCILNVGQN